MIRLAGLALRGPCAGTFGFMIWLGGLALWLGLKQLIWLGDSAWWFGFEGAV
jgi:hypothetical protein